MNIYKEEKIPVKSFETDSNPQKVGSDGEAVARAFAIEQVSRA